MLLPRMMQQLQAVNFLYEGTALAKGFEEFLVIDIEALHRGLLLGRAYNTLRVGPDPLDPVSVNCTKKIIIIVVV